MANNSQIKFSPGVPNRKSTARRPGQNVFRQASQRICNPLLKNVRPLTPGDLQSHLFILHSFLLAADFKSADLQ